MALNGDSVYFFSQTKLKLSYIITNKIVTVNWVNLIPYIMCCLCFLRRVLTLVDAAWLPTDSVPVSTARRPDPLMHKVIESAHPIASQMVVIEVRFFTANCPFQP